MDNTNDNPIQDMTNEQATTDQADASSTSDASTIEAPETAAQATGTDATPAQSAPETANMGGESAQSDNAQSDNAPAESAPQVGATSSEESAPSAPEPMQAPAASSVENAPALGATQNASTPSNSASAPRPSRQPSMAQVMESDEFSSYMSGVDALQRNALLRGVVVRVDENTGEALVDIGTKSEGIVARNEIGDEGVNVGDEIEVVVLRPEDDEGHPVLSKRRADYEKTWRVLQRAKEEQTDVEGTVREQVKGGLIVDLGVPAFVPASQVDARNRSDLSRFVGRTILLRVIEIDKKKNKVIASHRLAAENDRKKREEEAWGGLQKDKIVEGTVRRITDFGAFIDLGGIDGLLHVREMAWGRVEHPDHVVKKGQKLQVLILEIDEERKRVALGLKQLQSDPWKKAAKNLRPGQTITGKVVRLAPSCAFIELEDGIEGIIPISEMSEVRINKPEDVLAVGQQVEARLKQVQINQRRITLSLKAAVQERETRETRTAVRQVNERAVADDGVRLGDLFGTQLRAARDRGKERNEARSTARERALEAAELEEYDDDPALEVAADDSAVEDSATEESSVEESAEVVENSQPETVAEAAPAEESA